MVLFDYAYFGLQEYPLFVSNSLNFIDCCSLIALAGVFPAKVGSEPDA
jgi:hypothetical protein